MSHLLRLLLHKPTSYLTLQLPREREAIASRLVSSRLVFLHNRVVPKYGSIPTRQLRDDTWTEPNTNTSSLVQILTFISVSPVSHLGDQRELSVRLGALPARKARAYDNH
jgi:hypothetical protein